MKRIAILSLLLFLLAGCVRTTWETRGNGVLVKFKSANNVQAQQIKLEVLSDRIIHVIASPVKINTEEKSLCVSLDRESSSQFTVRQKIDTLEVSTALIRVRLSLKTGEVQFYDQYNQLLLREKEGGGKSFSPVSAGGTNGYSFSQVFESPEDEAFYGLGQHQSDVFNYKGLNESLYQYNTKVSVPFVVSNKKYGILWDNYSLTKFGDPRDYSQMDLFRLYDEKDIEGGLTASYSTGSDLQKIFIQRRESSIDYENLTTVEDFPPDFPFNGSTVTWTGKIEPRETGLYHFNLFYAGYTRLFINDEPVVEERWRTAWNPNTYKLSRYLEKGEKYNIRLEWKPDGEVSYIGLKVLGPRTPEEQGYLTLSSGIGNQIDYYFIRGNNLDEVISGYRTLTGKAPVIPRWALGYWQSRERYRSQTELLDVVKEYRKRKIPLDNIVLDWSYWPVDSWGSHEFDPHFFPDPAGMVEEVHRLNAKIMISVWPKFYYTTGHYKEFDNKGWMYRQAVNDSIRDWIGKGYIGSFYDPYSPGARELFWEQIREHLFTKGFDAWWMDASEPDILSNASMEYRRQLMTPTALGPSEKYFNTYALMNAMAIYEGQRSVEPDRRVFLLTRSGFAGLQRYSTATWSGDIGTRWEEMKAQISAGLNYAMSGIPYWTMDIGGFSVENRYTTAKEGSEDINEWRELNNRWYQFGSFCPLFRSHGQYPYREVFNISPENHPAYQSMVFYDRLRYRLMPYIYSLAGLTYFNDYTIMRALVMDFGHDPDVMSIGDQYMFGPSILVAPVYEYRARTREVYLPANAGWYDLYTGRYFEGGQTVTADAPYERMPLFVREGSIIPVGPEIQFTDEKPADPLTLYIYTGKDCAFTLYEDEGINYNYEKGECSTIKFSYNNESGEVTIGDRKGNYNGMLNERTFNIILISRENPAGFDPEVTADHTVRYDGTRIGVKRNK